MYKILTGIFIGLICAVWWYVIFDKYIAPSLSDTNSSTGSYMTGEVLLSGDVSMTGDSVSWDVSDQAIVNIALWWSLITGQDGDEISQVSEQWNAYGAWLSTEYDGYKDHIKEFIRLNPSSRNIPKEYMGCDIYDPKFSNIQQELYNKLLPYYDAKSDRWLVDIRNQREGYEDNDLSYVSDYIQHKQKNKVLLQDFLTNPNKYYIKKEIASYGDNQKWYSLHIYDITKKVVDLSEDAQQGLQKARQIYSPGFQWKDNLIYMSINLYDLEAIQRYVQTFTPECYVYNQYQKPQWRPHSINIKNIIQALERYGRWEEDLSLKSDWFEGNYIKVLEQANNHMIGFAYGMSQEIEQMHRSTPITLFYAWLYNAALTIFREREKGEMGFYYSDQSVDEEKVEYHKWRLIGSALKMNGRYPKIAPMQSCWNISKMSRDAKRTPDPQLYQTCMEAMGAYIDNIIKWTEKSDYINSAIESLKEMFNN